MNNPAFLEAPSPWTSHADVFVSPSTVHLEYVKSHIRADVIVGVQNVFHKKVGAHCVQWCLAVWCSDSGYGL